MEATRLAWNTLAFLSVPLLLLRRMKSTADIQTLLECSWPGNARMPNMNAINRALCVPDCVLSMGSARARMEFDNHRLMALIAREDIDC